jgi:hypothetical protein
MECSKNFVAFFQELKETIKIIEAKITALIQK